LRLRAIIAIFKTPSARAAATPADIAARSSYWVMESKIGPA